MSDIEIEAKKKTQRNKENDPQWSEEAYQVTRIETSILRVF
jgi:hypothetical protein